MRLLILVSLSFVSIKLFAQDNFPIPAGVKIEDIPFEISYYVRSTKPIGSTDSPCYIFFGDWLERLALLENPHNPEDNKYLVEVKYSKENCAKGKRLYLPTKEVVQHSVVREDYIEDSNPDDDRLRLMNQTVYFTGEAEMASVVYVTAFNMQTHRLRKCAIFLNSPLTVVGLRGSFYLLEMEDERTGSLCTKGARFFLRGGDLDSHRHTVPDEPGSIFAYYIGSADFGNGVLNMLSPLCVVSFGAELIVIEWGEDSVLVEVSDNDYSGENSCLLGDTYVVERDKIILGLKLLWPPID